MRVMVVGLGHVGRALLRAWGRVRPGVRLVAALDSRGRFERTEGLDPAEVVARKLRGEYDAPLDGTAAERIHAIHPDVLVELSVTDVETGKPAIDDIMTALRLGAHVVTSAKSHQRSRADIERIGQAARETGALFFDHAAHLAGIPVTEMMAGVGMEVTRLEGVLNGTTNFILKRLEEGTAFDAALDEAIRRGFAERDFRYDVQGTDVAIKLVGLARRLMGKTLDLSEIRLEGVAPGRLGIEGIDPSFVRGRLAAGERVKLFGEVEAAGDGLCARVAPRTFPLDDPFARVDGFRNAIAIHGVLNGTRMDLFLAGPGAGADETASRVLGNLNYLVDLLRMRAR
jgi:homoserine dehydrogenase